MKFLAKYVILNKSIQFREIQHALRVISLYNGGRMKKRFLCWLLSAIMLFANIPLNAYAQGEPYVVTVYNESNGLPTGEANVVMQSSDGYIWIGSYGGLIRYDGTQFRNYSTEGAIESSSARSIFEDSKGRLWVGTNDAGVYMMENDVFTHITADSKTDFLCVRGFCEGSDGTVYVGSNSGMGEISGDKILPYDIPEVLGQTVYCVGEDSLGRVWGAMNNGKCAIVKDGKLSEMFTSENVLSGSEIYSLTADKNGNIILGSSSNEVVRLSSFTENGSYTAERFSVGAVTSHNSVTVTETGSIMVAGMHGYAVIAPDGSVSEYTDDKEAASVNTIARDYEGNIWLSSSSFGVIKYSLGCISSPNNDAGLHDMAINTVAKANGRYYLGLDSGLMIFDSEWKPVDDELISAFSGVRIRNIITDSKGRIWIASYSENAVMCYDQDSRETKIYNTKNGLAGDKVRVLKELSDGRIAVGTQTGISIIKNDEITENYTYDDGMENASVLCFEEGKNGALYVGSDGAGIYEIKDGKLTNYGFEQGLGEGVVLRMLKNSDEDGYFVSAGSSLYYWKDGAFTKLSNFDKAQGSIFDFYDRDGKLWVLQNSGIRVVDKAQLLSGEPTEAVTYGTQHGLSGTLNANTWNFEDENGELIMATRSGISVFGFSGVSSKLPDVIINTVKVDSESYEHPESLDIASGAQRVTFDFSALSYSDTAPLKLSYKLTGFDESETVIDTEKSSSVSYTNLPGGSYTFEVKVYSSESPEVFNSCSIQFTKALRMTEQPLFWVLLAAAIVAATTAIVIVLVRVKLSIMNRRQQEYKSIVDQALLTFANAIDAKDKYTNGHSVRVAFYSRELAKRMGMSESEQEHIYYVALMHDIGKIGIPDNILNKPGKLTDEERKVIQTHVDIGGEILKDFTALSGITDGARYHHERYDGKGYSKGLKGEDIPQLARIIGVADTYDAMSSDRVYRKSLSEKVIIEELNKNSGTQFDPEVVPHMLDMIKDGTVPYKSE